MTKKQIETLKKLMEKLVESSFERKAQMRIELVAYLAGALDGIK